MKRVVDGEPIGCFVETGGRRFDDAAQLEAATGLQARVTSETDAGSTRHRMTLRHAGREPVWVTRAGLCLARPAGAADWRVFLDGGSMGWSGIRRLEAPDDADPSFVVRDAWHVTPDGRPLTGLRSSLLAMLYDPAAGTALVAGFLAQRAGLNFVDVWPEEGGSVSAIDAWAEFAVRPPGGRAVPSPLEIAPGTTIELDPLIVFGGTDPFASLEEFGRRVQAHHGRTFDEPPVVGLMTWYARRERVDETFVTEHLPILADLFQGYPQPMRPVMILDHGWQQDVALGDTQGDRTRFPRGLRRLAEDTRSHGFEFGIWLSTTHVTEDASNFAALRPMLALDSAGRPHQAQTVISARPVFKPDAAREDTRAWWRRQFQELSEVGARYFKIDFFAVRTSENNRVKAASRDLIAGAWRAFRESCPPGTHIAPCSCDSHFQLGHCDSMRASTDIGEAGAWPADMAAQRVRVHSIASKWYKQRRFWVNDPDSVQVGKGCSLGEARVRATTAAFSGGHFMVGDDLRDVSADRIELLRRMLPVYPVAARPLDLFEAIVPGDSPSVWALPVTAAGDTRTALALFNIGEQTRRFRVTAAMLGLDAAAPFAAYEWWQCRYLGVHVGGLDVDVPPGDVGVVHAAPIAPHPVLVSLSHHHTGWYIVENCAWDEAAGILRGMLRTKAGLPVALFGHAPESWALTAEGLFAGWCGRGNWQHEIRTTSERTPFAVPFRRTDAKPAGETVNVPDWCGAPAG
jgi:hypothetical protein